MNLRLSVPVALAVATSLASGCGKRAIRPGALDGGASPSSSADIGATEPEASSSSSSISTAGRPASASCERPTADSVCEPRCLQQDACVTAEVPVGEPDGPKERRCVECTADAHCRALPTAWGSRCDRERFRCTCETDADCNACFAGLSCDFGGVCACNVLGPTTDQCPPGKVCDGLACRDPCKPQDCGGSELCDQRRQSKTFGVCIRCLTDADCDAAAEPRCMEAWGKCGCTEDADCASSPSGRICLSYMMHTAGIGFFRSWCGCGEDADCAPGATCSEDEIEGPRHVCVAP